MKLQLFILALMLVLFGCAKKKPKITMKPVPEPVQQEIVVVAPDFEPEPELVVQQELPVIYFDYDKSYIRDDQLHKMGVMISLMQGGKCVVQGHACEIGTQEYNMALGEARAQTVVEWLMLLLFPLICWG